MSFFLLSQSQFDARLLGVQETNRTNTGKSFANQQTIRLKEHIEDQIKKSREVYGIFKVENNSNLQCRIIGSSILEKYKTILTLRLNKLKKSIQMSLFFSMPSGTFFRVHNKNKYAQITRDLLFKIDKNNFKIINISLNMVNGLLVAHFPICYLFNDFLQKNNSKGQSKLFKLYRDNVQQSIHLLEKIISCSNQDIPFGLQQSLTKKKIWENIYRYTHMMGISSHLNESYIQTEQEIMEKDRIKAIDIKRTIKNKQVLPTWTLRNSILFQQCTFLSNCLPQSQNSYYLTHDQYQYIRSILVMPIQPKSRHPCENNMILNHIFVKNINNISLNKINQGGFSQIFISEIDYYYVYSSEGHQVLYEENNQQQNNVLHKYVIVKKDTQIKQTLRNNHQTQILKQIKNGLSIFLPKYYIVVNKASVLSDAVVMDFIPFKNLREFLRSNYFSISLVTKIYLILSIVQSLRYIRDFRIVHLDLKPNNIMIFCNLLIKLIDFGESYHPQVCAGKHRPGFTIPYSPPEIYTNEDHQPFTSKSDVFSLGIIMYEILYNSRPFQVFEDTVEIDTAMKDYLNKWYFLPQEYETNGERQILRIFNFIISKCLSPKPKDRPELDWIALIVRQCLQLSSS